MEKLNKQRGLRNCNPLNIRRTADLWQGLAERQPDPEFFTFRSMPWATARPSSCCAPIATNMVYARYATSLPDGHRPRTVTTRKTTSGKYVC